MADRQTVKQQVISDTNELQKNFIRYESSPESFQLEALENTKSQLRTLLELADLKNQKLIEQKMTAIEQKICKKVHELRLRSCY
ncbi:MAG: hypothetical protein J5934_01735 [Succinivibrio sp.]|nr:hypothetical protein [Succinivibrio sp.]